MSDKPDPPGLADVRRRFEADARAKHARDMVNEAAQRAREGGWLFDNERYFTVADLLGEAPARRGRGRPPIGESHRREYLTAWETLKRKRKSPTADALAQTIGVDKRTVYRWLDRLPGLPTPEE